MGPKSFFGRQRQKRQRHAKYPHVLYAKPSNKVYSIGVWTKKYPGLRNNF